VPVWARAVLTLIAAIQVAMLGLATVWTPQGWSQVFGLPLATFRLAALAAAIPAALIAAVVWIMPGSRAAAGAFHLLERIRARRASIVLPVVCLIPALAFAASSRPSHALVGIQGLALAIFLYLADRQAWQPIGEQRLIAAALAALCLALGLRAWLLAVGFVWVDEGLYLDTAGNLLRGGGVTAGMFHLPPGIPIRPPWGYSIALYGLWARIFGLGLVQGRALSFILGLPALGFIAATARLWYGRRAGWITAAAAAFSYLFLQSAYLRNDAAAMSAAAGLVYLHAVATRQGRLWLHAALGLLCAVGLETHITLLYLFVAFGGVYAVQAVKEIARTRRLSLAAPLWAFAGGAALGLGIYIAIHVGMFPYPPSRYLSTITAASGSLHPFERAHLMIDRVRNYVAITPVDPAIIALGALGALIRRSEGDRHWLWLLLFSALGYAAIGHTSDVMYTIYAMPVLFLPVGALVTHGLGQATERVSVRERLALALIAVAMSSYAVDLILGQWNTQRQRTEQARPIVDYIRANVPPDAGIISSSTYPLYLPEYSPFLIVYSVDAGLGPAITGQSADVYWQDVLLRTWPDVHIDDGGRLSGMYESYLAARRFRRIMLDLLVVPGEYDRLVVDAPYASPNGARLQMVAHVSLPDALPGGTLEFDTIWVTRDAISSNTAADLALVAPSGQAIPLGSLPLVGGWSRTTTAQWASPRFYDVRFALRLPAEVPAGEYALRVSLSPSGPEAACQPTCAFAVGAVTVTR
jgi:hypothetical protein